MRIIETLSSLTTPTTDFAKKSFLAVSGALIGSTVFQSLGGMLSSSAMGVLLSFEKSPREQLINSVSFATIKLIVDRCLLDDHNLSCFISGIAVIVLTKKTVEEIGIIALSSQFVLSIPALIDNIFRYHFDKVLLGVSIAGEIFGSAALGLVISHDTITRGNLDDSFQKIFYPSLMTAVSSLATYYLYGPHDLYEHAMLLNRVATISAIITAGILFFEPRQEQNPIQRAPEPTRPNVALQVGSQMV